MLNYVHIASNSVIVPQLVQQVFTFEMYLYVSFFLAKQQTNLLNTYETGA